MPEFATVASTDELDDGEGTVVEANGHTIALFRVDGDFYAIGNECTHMGGPLGEGDLDGTTVPVPGMAHSLTSPLVKHSSLLPMNRNLTTRFVSTAARFRSPSEAHAALLQSV